MDKDIIIDYPYRYLDSVIYTAKLSQKGDCLDIRSDYLNSIAIKYDGDKICDNADPLQKYENCGLADLIIRENNKGIYIENTSSVASHDNDNCDSFETDELKNRLEKVRFCINKFQKYDPNKVPLSPEESIEKEKECIKKSL